MWVLGVTERRVMGAFWVLNLVLFLVQVVGIKGAHGIGEHGVRIWPMPLSVSHGHKSLYVGKDFKIMSQGSKYKDASGILKDGFSRFLAVVKGAHVVDGDTSKLDQSRVLQGLNVFISSTKDELQYGIDESYKLLVPSPDKPTYAHLELNVHEHYVLACGLLVATMHRQFMGLCMVFRLDIEPAMPIQLQFPDTSRHYQPLPIIKNVIDSMAYAKLNVLHWHIVDTQSFPLEIPSYPKLWDGAYSTSERYTMADAAEIKRGINVLAELDVPGHALSWGKGYPSLWPSKDCQEPLDVSNEFTFKVIDGILSDFSKVFKYKFVHLGGDEVNTSCWTLTPHVSKWLKEHSMNESQAYQYFVLQAQKIALLHGYEIVNWEETFNNFGNKLSPKTVVHNWLGGGVAQRVVAAGLRCIVSNQDKWYLDHLDTTWEQFYMNEPLTNITKSEQQKLVIGGEVCMWGETVDASDIQQTIWPRAAAAAERLWTPYDKLAKEAKQVTGRLAHFRCLLNQRGIAAAPLAADTPLTQPGRSAPLEPGSCYLQ
ncbi:Beta-hexosaminidase 3 [Citrus sinensis]|nr:Beta-hexosaminidase 3 [Citrus sinensis]